MYEIGFNKNVRNQTYKKEDEDFALFRNGTIHLFSRRD